MFGKVATPGFMIRFLTHEMLVQDTCQGRVILHIRPKNTNLPPQHPGFRMICELLLDSLCITLATCFRKRGTRDPDIYVKIGKMRG